MYTAGRLSNSVTDSATLRQQQDDAFNKMPANESHDITPQNDVKLKRAIHCKAIKIVIVVWPAALITYQQIDPPPFSVANMSCVAR